MLLFSVFYYHYYYHYYYQQQQQQQQQKQQQQYDNNNRSYFSGTQTAHLLVCTRSMETEFTVVQHSSSVPSSDIMKTTAKQTAQPGFSGCYTRQLLCPNSTVRVHLAKIIILLCLFTPSVESVDFLFVDFQYSLQIILLTINFTAVTLHLKPFALAVCVIYCVMQHKEEQ